MKTIELYGGFHNAKSIRVRISDESYVELKNGTIPVWEALSEAQEKRLNRHFCGVDGCTCGGVRNKNIKIEL